MHTLKSGSEFEVKIDSLAYGGKGVARVGNLVVFIKNVLPGQHVLARVVKKKKGFAEAIPLKVMVESPFVTSVPCEHFQTCGGCTFQNLDYEVQFQQKQRQVLDLYERIGGIKEVTLDKIIPADKLFHYRNKMEFSFSTHRWILPEEEEVTDRGFALGLHVPGHHEKILDIHTCWIQKPIGNRILQVVREAVRERRLAPYDIVKHRGFLRSLVIRVGERTGEVMVNLVTSREEIELLRPIVDYLCQNIPEITSIVNNVTQKKVEVSYGEWEISLHGLPYIHDQIGNYTFEISANSFFQTNTIQAEKLYKLVLNFASFSGEEILYDLYCGIGSTSIMMASQVKKVYGFELISSAVEDAIRNMLNNDVYNCQVFKANLNKYFRVTPILQEIKKPDVILLDPPRAGIHSKLLRDIIQIAPDKIIYISCNPSTQARDVRKLQECGYRLTSLGLVDMFPHTPHIETVALLRKV